MGRARRWRPARKSNTLFNAETGPDEGSPVMGGTEESTPRLTLVKFNNIKAWQMRTGWVLWDSRVENETRAAIWGTIAAYRGRILPKQE